jgi:hypothetical protein
MYSDPAETLAYCAGNCQASRYPPSTCRCPCQGRNHGILRGHRVIDVQPSYRTEETFPSDRIIPLLPEERLRLTAQSLGRDLDMLPSLSQNRVLEHPAPSTARIQQPRGRSIGNRIGRSLKHSLVGYSESELNERILKGLRTQFNQEHVDIAIDQAYSVFYSRDQNLPRPELYELYETGLIDKALELMGKRWVIGRPKK